MELKKENFRLEPKEGKYGKYNEIYYNNNLVGRKERWDVYISDFLKFTSNRPFHFDINDIIKSVNMYIGHYNYIKDIDLKKLKFEKGYNIKSGRVYYEGKKIFTITRGSSEYYIDNNEGKGILVGNGYLRHGSVCLRRPYLRPGRGVDGHATNRQ